MAVTVTLSWAQGFGDDDVEVTRVLAYPLHAAVPLCACVWAELQAKRGRSAVSRDSIAAKLSAWGSVCVCHARLVFDWCVPYQSAATITTYLTYSLCSVGTILRHHLCSRTANAVPKGRQCNYVAF